jgi:hypothetical protein
MGKGCSPKWANVHSDTEAEKSWNYSPVFSSHEAELGQNRRVTEVTRRNYLGTISKIFAGAIEAVENALRRSVHPKN